MRKMNLAGALFGSMILLCAAAAANADCGCSGMSNRSYNSLSGPPCFSPPGCCLAPGCCDCPPTACDNAWAGYCQQKAKWQAFFTKVGTPRPSCCYGNGGYGNCGSPTPAVKELPADSTSSPRPAAGAEPPKTELPPAPAPEKTSRAQGVISLAALRTRK